MALAILRDDVQRLSRATAAKCRVYLTTITMPDLWASALVRDLDARAGDTPRPDFDALVVEVGKPGRWTPASRVGDAWDMRLWLGAVETLAALHAPSPSTAL
ncbi:hypothetical protein WKW77_10075 [Variovorax ureilyticus]|uniref:Uncharacterized protein n=1 Tax=Variovorax ureilyticus TaxID=1836198 RepID=A0ABU8VDZ8_9BURK